MFGALDWAVVAAYFLLVFGVAFQARLRGRTGHEAADYFLAGRNVGWFIVGASIFASNIGAEHLVGLAGSGATGGVAPAQFEILASLILLLLGWLFVPFYVSSGVFTMPEFLERRFSGGARTYLAAVSIVGYILTKISVTIAAGAIVFEVLMGVPFWTGAVIVVVTTGAYTMWGGLRAVLYTDMIQMFVLIGGAVAVTVIGLGAVGGWSGLTAALPAESFSVWRPSSHPDYPWTGVLFGAPILAIWYWCTDQFIVQRVLSAKNVTEARRGALFAGFLKQLPLFIFVVPGLIAVALMQSGRMEFEGDQALPTLVQTLLPTGLRGLMAAGLLAALMSSLSSVFNSAATLICVDIVKRAKPSISEHRLVQIGRVGVLAMTILGIMWVPFMDVISGQIFTYIQSVQAYIAPPIAAVFLFGVLWARANAAGASAALAVGAVLGVARLTAEALWSGATGAVGAFVGVNFLHFAFLLFVLCAVVLVTVSLMTAPPAAEKLRGMTLAAVRGVDRGTRRQRHGDIALSVLLVVLVLGVWAYFSPLVH
jgi:SSS family solute:Na+ symporter